MRTYDTPRWVEAFATGKELFPLPMESLALPRQVHSCHVERVSHPGRPEATDAVFTSVVGLPLAVKTADCIPILLYDTRQRLAAAVHAGWRGTVSHIVAKTIEAMRSHGEDLHAILCPGISADAFEVGDEVYDAFLAAGFPMERIAQRRDKWHINLRQANACLLEQCGVGDILIDDTCTFASPLHYSARRETIATGRNFSCITIKE